MLKSNYLSPCSLLIFLYPRGIPPFVIVWYPSRCAMPIKVQAQSSVWLYLPGIQVLMRLRQGNCYEFKASWDMDMVMPGDGDKRIREFKMVFINIASSMPALVTQEFFFIPIVIRWYHMYIHLQHFYIFSYLHVLNCMFFF